MKCPHCPLADRPEPCAAATSGAANYCRLMDPGHPHYDPILAPAIVTLSLGRDEPQPAPAPPPHQAAVYACPHRGPVLPHTQQPECGCAELTECAAGKGKRPGAVTLAECLQCVHDQVNGINER